ncbi:MAG: type II secretion system F family protein [Phycisphaerae bacterium]
MLPELLPQELAQSQVAVYILPVLGSVLLAYGIFQVIVDSQSARKRKITDRLQGHRPQAKKGSSITRRGAFDDGRTFAESVVGKFKFIPKLQTVLDQADLDWSASQVMLNLCGASSVVTVVLFMFHVFYAVALLCGGAVLVLPLLWINFRRVRRMSRLESQLPDVFEMMGQALRAGHSLAGAIQVVYEQLPPPIAKEFARVYHEQNLGIKIEEALEAMANRVDSLDVRFFVTAVNIQRSTGGDLAEVLDNISGVIRERIELKGLVRGLTAEGRLSGWVLFALPAVVFVGSLYMNPDYGSVLLEDPMGQIMLMIAVGLQLMGIAMIRWIVNIKV